MYGIHFYTIIPKLLYMVLEKVGQLLPYFYTIFKLERKW